MWCLLQSLYVEQYKSLVVRGRCLQCTNDPLGVCFIIIVSKDPRQAKIWNFGVHIFIQQDIANFEITVYYSEPWVPVKVQEASSNPLDDIVSCFPI